jgi:branched-chain amino acid transport system substrate-binding protein
MSHLFPRGVRRAACVVAVGIGVAACGSTSSGSTSTASPATGSSVEAAASTAGGSSAGSLKSAVTIFSRYVGGKPGRASGAPISIGFFDDEGGVPSFPEGAVAAAAAVRFVNTNLGGADGRPLRLVSCFVSTSEQQGQGCAQQFLAQKVDLIIEQSAVVGGDSFHQALAGRIPVIIGDPVTPADLSAKNSYALTAGSFGTPPGYVAYTEDELHAKSVSFLYPSSDATAQTVATNLKSTLEKQGTKVILAGVSATAPDLLPAVDAAQVSSTDATLTLFPTTAMCIAGEKAFQQAGLTKPVVSLGLCLAAPVKAALGDYPKWTYVSINTNPFVAGDPSTDAYLSVMKAYAPAGANVGGAAPWAFVPVLAAARTLNLAGGTRASISTVATDLRTASMPPPMFAPKVAYGSVPGAPTLPNALTRFYTYAGNGKWTLSGGGKWY